MHDQDGPWGKIMGRAANIVLSLVLLGCAHQSPMPDGTLVENLTPVQLREAFERTAACAIYEEDNTCEFIIVADQIADHTFSIREIGANDIARQINEPMGQFVRELPLYREHSGLFVELEAQRLRGNFRYLKTVGRSTATLDSEAQRWCWRNDGTFDDTAFYFSNTLSAHVEQDQRLDAEAERGLRAFLVDVINNAAFRAVIESHPDGQAGLDLVRGVAGGCTQYSGVIVGRRIELRGISITVSGAEVPYSRNRIRPYSIDGPLPIRAN